MCQCTYCQLQIESVSSDKKTERDRKLLGEHGEYKKLESGVGKMKTHFWPV